MLITKPISVTEGKRDAEFRGFAQRTHAAMSRVLDEASLRRVMRWNARFMVWSIPADVVYPHLLWPDGVTPERLSLSFAYTDAYRAVYRPRHAASSRQYAVLEVSVDEPLMALNRHADHGYSDAYGLFIDGDAFPKYVAACWMQRRMSVVHELIHLYDRSRSTDPASMDRELRKIPTAMKTPDSPFYSAYFGTNHEYNAHVQTLLLLLDDTPQVTHMKPQQIVNYVDRAVTKPESPFASLAAWWRFVRNDPVYKRRVFRRIAAWRPSAAQ